MTIFSLVLQVEQILARRQVESDQTEYLVRWRGFESDQDSWEPLDRLGRAAHHIVAQFNERSHRHPQQHLNASFGKHIQGKVTAFSQLFATLPCSLGV